MIRIGGSDGARAPTDLLGLQSAAAKQFHLCTKYNDAYGELRALIGGGRNWLQGKSMPSVFGSFDKLTEAFAAAAMDPTRWDAAMDVASDATGSLGAMLFPVQGRTPTLPKSGSLQGLAEDYLGGGWVHRDERYRSVPALLRRGVSSEFDFTTPEEIAKSPYYQDFLGPPWPEVVCGRESGRRRRRLGPGAAAHDRAGRRFPRRTEPTCRIVARAGRSGNSGSRFRVGAHRRRAESFCPSRQAQSFG